MADHMGLVKQNPLLNAYPTYSHRMSTVLPLGLRPSMYLHRTLDPAVLSLAGVLVDLGGPPVSRVDARHGGARCSCLPCHCLVFWLPL